MEYKLEQSDFEWIFQKPIVLNHNYKLNRYETLQLFAISNRLTGKSERPSGCGRCLYNVRERIKKAYEKHELK